MVWEHNSNPLRHLGTSSTAGVHFPSQSPNPSHPLSIDDTVAALEGTRLRVSVELL